MRLSFSRANAVPLLIRFLFNKKKDDRFSGSNSPPDFDIGNRQGGKPKGRRKGKHF